MNNFAKNLALWIIIGLLLVTLFNLFGGSSKNNTHSNISFTEFIAEVDSGNVNSVNIKGNNVTNENVIRGELLLDEGDPFSKLGLDKSISEYILVMDGDLQHDPKYIPNLYFK